METIRSLAQQGLRIVFEDGIDIAEHCSRLC